MMKRILCCGVGIAVAICLILALLITAVEAVCYWVPGYFPHEYEKHAVPESVSMEMDELLSVTDHMMAYLRGGAGDLQIDAVVAGQTRPFFNAREIAHMEDVKGLFLGGLRLRRICLGLAGLGLLVLWRCRMLRLLPGALCAGTGLFFGAACVLAAVIASDFDRAFTVFHHLFFDNDLWILNPRTDLLVNIVPEPFFMDTATAIAGVFGAAVALLFGVSLFAARRMRGARGRQSTGA